MDQEYSGPVIIYATQENLIAMYGALSLYQASEVDVGVRNSIGRTQQKVCLCLLQLDTISTRLREDVCSQLQRLDQKLGVTQTLELQRAEYYQAVGELMPDHAKGGRFKKVLKAPL